MMDRDDEPGRRLHAVHCRASGLGDPAQLDSTLLYLVSPASEFVTGTVDPRRRRPGSPLDDRSVRCRPMVDIGGSVEPGWEKVADAFRANFDDGKELGAAVAVYREGQPVVDLWGGVADRETGRPWAEDTIVLVFSSTKGMTAILASLLAQRGELDIDAPVATYWPEFAASGKEAHPGPLAAVPPGRARRRRPHLRHRRVLRLGPDRRRARRPGADVGAGQAARLPRPHLRPPRGRGAPPHQRQDASASCSPTRSPVRSASRPGSACPSRRSRACGPPRAGAAGRARGAAAAARHGVRPGLAVRPVRSSAPPPGWSPRTAAGSARRQIRAAEIPAGNLVTDARSLARVYAVNDRRGRRHPPALRRRPSRRPRTVQTDTSEPFGMPPGLEDFGITMGLGFQLHTPAGRPPRPDARSATAAPAARWAWPPPSTASASAT